MRWVIVPQCQLRSWFNLPKSSRLDYHKDWYILWGQVKSAARYRQLGRDYVNPYFGRQKLSDLGLDNIEQLYQTLLRKGVSVRNVRYVHSLLHRSLNDAVKRGLAGFNAAHGARQPKLPQRELQILDEDQVMQLLIIARGDRLEALLHLAVKTGMRKGEILGLKWSDLDWKRGLIRVQRQVQRVTGKGWYSWPRKRGLAGAPSRLGSRLSKSCESIGTDSRSNVPWPAKGGGKTISSFLPG